MNDTSREIVRRSTSAEQGSEDDLRKMSVEDRWNVMWQLAVDAWAMKGEDVAEQAFQRHVECLKQLNT